MANRRIKILAIDDNPDNLVTIKALIKETFPDALILTTCDGREGLSIATAEDPDVILLDIVMPVMDGFEVCRILKADKYLGDIPVVFVTALKGDKDSRLRALEAGAEAFLAKPLDPIELTAQIRAMVKIKLSNLEKRNESERLASLIAEQTRDLQETNIATLNLLEDLRNENAARKAGEEALRISEEKYRSIFENVQDVFYQTNLSGIVLEISPSIKHFSEFNREDILGQPVYSLYAEPKDRDILLKSIRKSGELRDYELKLRTKTGDIRYVSINARLITDPEGNPHHIDGAIRDITERIMAEKQIKLLSQAISQSPVTIVITDKNGNIEYANPKFTEITGYSLDEIRGRNPRLLQSGNQTREFYREMWDTILSGKDWHGEFQNRKKNGDSYWESAVISSLVNSEGEISHFIGIKEDVTEKRKLMIDLVEAKDRAEESDRLKSAFLANMSHEIRTPMNGILGFAGLLKEPELTGAEQQKYIRIIEKSGARMLNIINDIVTIAKIESGQMEMYISETNVNEQIEYIYTFFKPEAEQKGLELSCSKPLSKELAVISTDREKLYAILTGLVKNAIKFCDRGQVSFGYTLKDRDLEFFVKDTGIGIPPDRLQAIFKSFVQADISDKRAFQGAGLGLSISKAFVEMLGGSIRVESSEGKGSVFFFTLPYLTATPDVQGGNPLAEPAPPSKIRPLKILLAEDDEASAVFITLSLKNFSSEILQSRNGTETVDVCRANPDIDLVLMDIKMPVMDGYDATREIRKFNPGVIIIAQTAYGLSGDKEKSLAAGCNGYIAKPIRREELMKLISGFFNRVPAKPSEQ